MPKPKRQSKPLTPLGMKHVQTVHSKDSAASMDRCRVCGDSIGFTTIDGKLVPLDWGTLRPHKHQNG
ncbi:MAG: hypothetical protein KAJ55_00180 [Anaerolineales bacterium]|nr:hypothetical protein [Anaerolineales bacterium]